MLFVKMKKDCFCLLVSSCDDGGNFFLLGTQEKTFLEVERFENNFLRPGEQVFSLRDLDTDEDRSS